MSYDEHQAMWPQMIAALAAIDAALGLPEDGCNSLAQTLAAIRALKAKAEISQALAKTATAGNWQTPVVHDHNEEPDPRYTAQEVADQLRARSDALLTARKFDVGNGTAQLCPRGIDAATQALIDRAVDYGRWYTLWNLAQDVEDGCIGVA